MMSTQGMGGDGSAEQPFQGTNEHPDRIRALRKFRARLLDWLEDIGACACVDLTGEGECVIQIDLSDGEWGVLQLRTDTTH